MDAQAVVYNAVPESTNTCWMPTDCTDDMALTSFGDTGPFDPDLYCIPNITACMGDCKLGSMFRRMFMTWGPVIQL